MKVGIHEQYQGRTPTTVGRTVESFPAVEVTREFEADVLRPQDLVRRMLTRCEHVWASGQTVVWSFKPNPADVANGAWKPHVQALARHILDNRLQQKVIICIWHEPENDAPKYFRNGLEFARLFDTVQAWLFDVDPTIDTTHAALGYAYRNWTVPQARLWVTQCTIHSIDVYSGRSFPLGMTLGTSRAFQTWRASRPAGARWGVSERGWIADAEASDERVAAIDLEAEWLAALDLLDRPDFYIVWNTAGVEDDPKIILDDAGVAAVNRLFARMSVLTITCPTCKGVGTVTVPIT